MRKTVGWVLVLMLTTASLSHAESAQEVLEKVRKKYNSIKDAELKFSQRTTFELTRVEQNVNGTLLLKKENKYRVELQDQTIVTNGVTVWSYSAIHKQVLIDRFKLDERSLSPERILTGAPTDFYATVIGKEDVGRTETIVLKLVPKDEQAFVRSMKLWVEDGNWLIKRVEVIDVNGKQTLYTVNDIRLNTGVQDSRFTYQIPEGVEVVDLR